MVLKIQMMKGKAHLSHQSDGQVTQQRSCTIDCHYLTHYVIYLLYLMYDNCRYECHYMRLDA